MALTLLLVKDESHSEYEPLNRNGQIRYVNRGFPKQGPDVTTILGMNQRLVITALATGIILVAADSSIVVADYDRIGKEFSEVNRTSWVSVCYSLPVFCGYVVLTALRTVTAPTITSFQPLYGRLSHIYGGKPCLFFSYTVFGIRCLFCGISQNMNQLISARAIAGMEGAG